MKPGIVFFVPGTPPTKQNFDPGHRKTERVKAWEEAVGWAAKSALQEFPLFERLTGPVKVDLRFLLPDHKRRDLDNLAKPTLDGCNGILWDDDSQINDLSLVKNINKKTPGVNIIVWIESEE